MPIRNAEIARILEHTAEVLELEGANPFRVRAYRNAARTVSSLPHAIVGMLAAGEDLAELPGFGAKLDLPNSILEKLDIVVGAIQSKFGLSRSKQTERIIRAMDNPNFNILAHPTGRLIGERPPCEVDLGRPLEAARERGCILEVNAQPDRLDLNGDHCRMAKEIGVKLALSSDAHRPSDFGLLQFAIDQARRGWLEPDDVVNTRSQRALLGLLECR